MSQSNNAGDGELPLADLLNERPTTRDPNEFVLELPDAPTVADLTPACKTIRLALVYDGPLTLKALSEVTLLSTRTLRFALKQMADKGAIRSWQNPDDGRQDVYALTEGH